MQHCTGFIIVNNAKINNKIQLIKKKLKYIKTIMAKKN